MKSKKSSLFTIAAFFLCAAVAANAQDFYELNAAPQETQTKFDFADAPQINVATAEELYTAVNNSANTGNQIVLAAGVYSLSVNDPGGAARPNGGRLELQENMSLRGVAGNRGAVVIDAANLPTASYAGTAPVTNTGAIRTGKGSNSVEWLTIRNAVSGGAGIIVHLNAPGGAAYVRIAHCVSTGNSRGVDVRNVGNSATGYVLETEFVDNDFYSNRISTAQGLRIINSGGADNSVITAYLSGNRIFDNNQGLLVENLGSTNGGIISVYSSGDRFYENGGGATIGAAFGPTNNSTVNFTAIGSAFENNNGFTDLYRGGLNVAGSVSFQTPNGGSNNTANVFLRNCRFANNQVADLAAYGASSLPVSIGASGTNNRANVRLFGTLTSNVVTADSDPVNPAGMNSARLVRNSVTPTFDFDGDGRADLSVFRPSNGFWYLNRSRSGFNAVQFGISTDKLVPADYDGDGKTDIAVFRDGVWYWINSSNGSFQRAQFGQAGDITVPADYTGDGRAEIAVFRSGGWHTLNLSNNQFQSTQFGVETDKPVVADYDGDGKADIAVVRRSGGFSIWYVSGSSRGFYGFQFGNDTDIPVPADYDGDGKTDFAVVRNLRWHIWGSATNSLQTIIWNVESDALVPADYDGDGKTDVATFSDGVWSIRQTNKGNTFVLFGFGSDEPTNRVQ